MERPRPADRRHRSRCRRARAASARKRSGRACSARASAAAPASDDRRLGSDAVLRLAQGRPPGRSGRAVRDRRGDRGDGPGGPPIGRPVTHRHDLRHRRRWHPDPRGADRDPHREGRAAGLAVPRADDDGERRRRRRSRCGSASTGPNETICTACAAGTHAIGYAARLIAWGLADAVVTGGTEARRHRRRRWPASAT